MQRADRAQEALPVSLIFDRVLQANTQAIVTTLAKTYAQHEHFKDDRRMMQSLIGRLDDVSDEVGRKNWALFCLQVLLKKEYNPLVHNQEALNTLVEKTESIPGFQFGVLGLKGLLNFKLEEYQLKTYVDWLYKNPDQLRHAVLAHSWYFESPRFIKDFLRQGIISEDRLKFMAEGLLVLSHCQPDLFSCYSVRKSVNKILPLLPEDAAEKLWGVLQASLGNKGSTLSKTPSKGGGSPRLIDFDSVYKNFMDKKEETPLFLQLAEDLAARSTDLFLKCRLNDFERLNFSKGLAYNISAITSQFNQISEFVKQKIISQTNKKNKARAISFFINLANESYRKSDHHSTFAILSALESADVSNPKEVWDLIDEALVGKEKFMVDRFSPINNYKNFRAFIYTYERLDQAYIPFLGPFLTELTFAHEGNPDYIETESGDKLINFEKTKMIGAMLQRLFTLQEKLSLKKEKQSDLIAKIECTRGKIGTT